MTVVPARKRKRKRQRKKNARKKNPAHRLVFNKNNIFFVAIKSNLKRFHSLHNKHKQTKSKSKKNKDDDRPKRPTTAFMVWLNEKREEIKKDNPGIKVTEIAKKGGEMWREMKDKSIWEEKAAKDKERYTNEMKNYKPSGDASSSSSKRKKESSSPKKVTNTTMGGSGFKSKEYISEEDSSDSNSDKKKKKKRKVIINFI